jgi:2-methylcitrate dehydratase PrpD
MAAYFGDVSEERYASTVVENTDIQALASRITSQTDQRWTNAYPAERGATISIKSQAGEAYVVEVPLAKGEPENPATDDDFVAKFKQNGAAQDPVLLENLLKTILDLEHQPVCALTSLMSKIQS